MKRIPFFILLLLSLLLAACAPQPVAPADQPVSPQVTETAQAPTPLELVDGMGRTVTLLEPAKTVVSLAPSNTELLFAVNAGEQVIARDDFSDYPAEAVELPTIGGSMGNLNYEEIARLQPDLVLAAGIITAEQVKALEDLGLTVYYLANPTDFEGLYANIFVVGQLTGHGPEAGELITSLRNRVEAVTAALGSVTERPTVFYELDASDPAKPWTAGPGTFVDYLIAQAGGSNIGANLSGEWAQISQEELIVQDPDLILLGDSAYGITVESVAARAGWETLSAVQNEKVFPFDDDLVSRPSHRMVDGLVTLAKLIHPDLAANLQ